VLTGVTGVNYILIYGQEDAALEIYIIIKFRITIIRYQKNSENIINIR
jgi:hypothetical protein